ncbi:MAG TPA: hypothetical protein PK942_09010, partial [Verrucomicrobiota bacterium]|nr:hypothetical protein [Verrucomicrobiota bacterium]
MYVGKFDEHPVSIPCTPLVHGALAGYFTPVRRVEGRIDCLLELEGFEGLEARAPGWRAFLR